MMQVRQKAYVERELRLRKEERRREIISRIIEGVQAVALVAVYTIIFMAVLILRGI